MLKNFKRKDSHSGILNSVSDNFIVTSKNFRLERHKKTALKHSSSMNECQSQKLWR